jgi:D-aminopeptidase
MSGPSAARGPRPRECGITIGRLPTGPRNAITDVAGIRVGHATVWRDEPDPPEGRGIARTGVTAIVPQGGASLRATPLAAGASVLNGAGEVTGRTQIDEWGVIETPVYLTSTMQVGRVYDAACTLAVEADPVVGVDWVVIPVVGECDDSWLNDARCPQIEEADVRRAVAGAGEDVAEGAVGAGTGMLLYDWKGGIGTASRRIEEVGATVGVLLLANFGDGPDLRIDGVRIGEDLRSGVDFGASAGSCIGVVATDAPLDAATLTRLATRVGLGLARTGSVAHHGSGEIFIAFSTAPREAPRLEDRHLNTLFSAVVEASEEAVVNALWAADDVTGRMDRTLPGIPHADVLDRLREAGRLA